MSVTRGAVKRFNLESRQNESVTTDKNDGDTPAKKRRQKKSVISEEINVTKEAPLIRSSKVNKGEAQFEQPVPRNETKTSGIIPPQSNPFVFQMTPEQMLSSGLQFVQTDSLNSDGTPQIIPMQLTTLPDGQTVMMPAQFHVLSRGNEIDNTNKIVSHLNNSNAPVVQMISNSGCSSAQSSEQVNTETNSDISEANDGQTVYVNQLQFKRIMARREARLKLLMGGKLPKQRQKYLHESRHKHAQKRVRGVAGAFA